MSLHVKEEHYTLQAEVSFSEILEFFYYKLEFKKYIYWGILDNFRLM